MVNSAEVNVSERRLDSGSYDLLASEARLATFVAIAQGRAPDESWFALGRRITGSGVCVVIVDTPSGNVTSAVMEQSTGNAILDKVTTDAFRKWRFKPGTVSQIRVPISYE